MFVDNVIIVSLIVGCLVFFLLVGIFVAVFQRKLGSKHCEKLEEGDVSEKQRLTPMPDEAQLQFTTKTVQPESKTSSVLGYPHVQVSVSSCTLSNIESTNRQLIAEELRIKENKQSKKQCLLSISITLYNLTAMIAISKPSMIL